MWVRLGGRENTHTRGKAGVKTLYFRRLLFVCFVSLHSFTSAFKTGRPSCECILFSLLFDSFFGVAAYEMLMLRLWISIRYCVWLILPIRMLHFKAAVRLSCGKDSLKRIHISSLGTKIYTLRFTGWRETRPFFTLVLIYGVFPSSVKQANCIRVLINLYKP